MNNKGYMLVELILASTIAFLIAYYAIDITIKLKEKNDDIIVETIVSTDRAIITNTIMDYLKKDVYNFNCDRLEVKDNTISYDNKVIDIINQYSQLSEKECTKDKNNINIKIPINVKQLNNKNFDIIINYKIDIAAEWIYDYTGTIQELKAPYSGKYQLEVYGAQGGNGGNGIGGKGGYSTGIVNLTKGEVLYIVVGGKPLNNNGGYNGGGNSINDGGAGGGATHIAKSSGLLNSLSSKANTILIIAGGGGGAARDITSGDVYNDGEDYYNMAHNGGAGGGTTGGSGQGNKSPAKGGGQSAYSASSTLVSVGTFGQGGNGHNLAAEGVAGGGGGYYGGESGSYSNSNSGGGGGSGYIGGVTSGQMKDGIREGDGFAKISFIAE